MLLKSQEVFLKKKEFFKEKIVLLFGENQDLIRDINEKITAKFADEKIISRNIFEEDVVKTQRILLIIILMDHFLMKIKIF